MTWVHKLQTMKNFLCEDFLLSNETAAVCTMNARKPPADLWLSLPHLNPAEVAQDDQFENMSKIWLEGDHYKWRGMRSAKGIDERLITEGASDYDKFMG